MRQKKKSSTIWTGGQNEGKKEPVRPGGGEKAKKEKIVQPFPRSSGRGGVRPALVGGERG